MTYIAENPQTDGSTVSGARPPRLRPPRLCDPHDTSPAPTTTGWWEDKCPVVSRRPLHSHAAAKMSPHIHIGPEPVLASHAPSPPGAGSHCLAREDPAPHCGTEFNQPHPGWAPDPLMVGIRSPDGLVVGSCTSHHRVLGSIPQRAYDTSALHSTSR
jgi:hypothetical protein